MADNFVRKTTNFEKKTDVSLTFYNEGDMILLRDGSVHVVTIVNNKKQLSKLSTSNDLSKVVRTINGHEPNAKGDITVYQPVSIYKQEDENNVYIYATATKATEVIATQPKATLSAVGSYPASNNITFTSSEINGAFKATVPKGSSVQYVGIYFADNQASVRKLNKIVEIPAKTA